MCGIAALIKGTGAYPETEYWTYMSIYFGTVRGEDSTGVAAIKADGAPYIFRTLLQGNLAVDTKKYLSYAAANLVQATNVRAVITHNRKATRGSMGIDAAHPMTEGRITLVHNGTLDDNEWRTLGLVSDSHYLAHRIAMSEDPYARDVFESIDGAFACIWYNSETKTIYFVRNTERPLFYSELDGGKEGIAIASEAWMLEASLRSQKYNYTCAPTDCSPKKIYSIEVDDVYDKDTKEVRLVNVEYSPKEPKKIFGYSGGYYGAFANNTHTSAASATADKKNVPVIVTGNAVPVNSQLPREAPKSWTQECASTRLPISGDFVDLKPLAKELAKGIANANTKVKLTQLGKLATSCGLNISPNTSALFVILAHRRHRKAKDTVVFKGVLLGAHEDYIYPKVIGAFPLKVGGIGGDRRPLYSSLKSCINVGEYPIVDASISSILGNETDGTVDMYLKSESVELVCTLSELTNQEEYDFIDEGGADKLMEA